MSRWTLVAALVGSLLVVGAIAAVTVTVIVDDEDGVRQVVRPQAAPAPGRGPGAPTMPGAPNPGRGQGQLPGLAPGNGQGKGQGQGQGRNGGRGQAAPGRGRQTPFGIPGGGMLRSLRDCLQQQGLLPRGQGRPDLEKLRTALQACAPKLFVPQTG